MPESSWGIVMVILPSHKLSRALRDYEGLHAPLAGGEVVVVVGEPSYANGREVWLSGVGKCSASVHFVFHTFYHRYMSFTSI